MRFRELQVGRNIAKITHFYIVIMAEGNEINQADGISKLRNREMRNVELCFLMDFFHYLYISSRFFIYEKREMRWFKTLML